MLFKFVKSIKKKLDVYFCRNILWLTSVFHKCILELRTVYAWMQGKKLANLRAYAWFYQVCSRESSQDFFEVILKLW